LREEPLNLTAGLAVPFSRAGPTSRPRAVAPEEIQRSASIYSALDVAKAAMAGAQISDRTSVIDRFKTLHYEVLENPSDTAKRAELAKYQIQYRVNNEALYNLKRVDLTTEQSLKRYDIDPGTLQRGLTTANRDYYKARIRPEVLTPVAVRTTDTDLELIAAGKLEEAVKSLLSRVESGYATSRDYYALSKAYLELKDVKRSMAYGERALRLNEEDRKLSETELREQRAILARIRG
jgi:tetratricopeptide (TPR) repeat protein